MALDCYDRNSRRVSPQEHVLSWERLLNYRSILSNMSVAFLAQGIGMLFGILQSLIVPKLLGVEEFGYWQLFIFYTGYVGVLHLGLNDGVYLTTGGKTRESIDKQSVFSQLVVGICFQTVIAIVIALAALSSGIEADRFFVIACTCIMIVLLNATNYICSVLQAMNETKKSSYVAVASKCAYLIPLAFFLFLRIDHFQPYVITYVIATALGLLFGAHYLTDFARAGLSEPRTVLAESARSIRIGINLMVSNIASGLVIGIARFLIDAQWGISTFGQLSLSLSMVNLFFVFVNQASLVLFPALRQSGQSEIKGFFHALRDAMSLFMPAVYILYFPFVWLLSLWLPQYAESLAAFAFLIPICAFDGKMDIFCSTYFKVARKEKTLLHINLASVAIGAVGSAIGAFVLNSVDFILLWMVFTIILRSFVSERIASDMLGLPDTALSTQEVAITALFIAFARTLPDMATIPLYLLIYFLYLFLNRQRVQEVLNGARNVVRH